MNNLFEKLIQKEEKFYSDGFLCPAHNGLATVVNDGVRFNLNCIPKDFSGYGIFKLINNQCVLQHEARNRQKDKYLNSFHTIIGIVCSLDQCLILPEKEIVKVNFIENQEIFSTVILKYNGLDYYYYKELVNRSKHSKYLRNCLSENIKLEKLDKKHLTLFEKHLYGILYNIKVNSLKNKIEFKIENALNRNNALLNSFKKVDGNILVEYIVDGETHKTLISEDLNVINAGICLDGYDENYDLTSLVNVIREGQNNNLIYRVGQNR